MRLLHAVVESEGVTALVATHDPNLISIADSVLELQDGQIKGNWSERSAVRADHGPLPPFRRGAGARSCARPALDLARGRRLLIIVDRYPVLAVVTVHDLARITRRGCRWWR